jgi:hypothetical protein
MCFDVGQLKWLLISNEVFSNELASFRFAVLPSSTYLFTVRVEGFYFHLITLKTHTTVGRTPLDEGSARRRDLYLSTQTLCKSGNRTHVTSKRSAADLHFRPRGHWDRLKWAHSATIIAKVSRKCKHDDDDDDDMKLTQHPRNVYCSPPPPRHFRCKERYGLIYRNLHLPQAAGEIVNGTG